MLLIYIHMAIRFQTTWRARAHAHTHTHTDTDTHAVCFVCCCCVVVSFASVVLPPNLFGTPPAEVYKTCRNFI